MDEIRAFMIETVGPPLADDVRSRHRDDALVLTPGAEIG
jgi:hypothetical protein